MSAPHQHVAVALQWTFRTAYRFFGPYLRTAHRPLDRRWRAWQWFRAQEAGTVQHTSKQVATFIQWSGREIAAIQMQQVERHEHERVSGLMMEGLKRRKPSSSTATTSPSSSNDSARSRPTSRVMAG
jgi:hypothetical protein